MKTNQNEELGYWENRKVLATENIIGVVKRIFDADKLTNYVRTTTDLILEVRAGLYDKEVHVRNDINKLTDNIFEINMFLTELKDTLEEYEFMNQKFE